MPHDTITAASHQWATRPADERFLSLHALAAYTSYQKKHSKPVVTSNRRIEVRPVGDNLAVFGPADVGYEPTHWAFGQLCQRTNSPASYLRTLPAALTADCLNYGLQITREVEDIGLLLRKNGVDSGAPQATLAAATGPNYGRVWNADIAAKLVSLYGDGLTGQWRVPGEFGKKVEVTKENTTLYASDRDMFCFLCDEDHRIEVPNRRPGTSGSLARGFYVWNSEVGAQTIGAAFFLFDYVCCNRIIWGAADFQEVRIRHTAGAPDRWLEEIVPILNEYATSSPKSVTETIAAARAARIRTDLDTFLANRFGKNVVASIIKAHEVDEHRPIETVWDAVVGATAYARTLTHQDTRIRVERLAGDLLSQKQLVPAYLPTALDL